MFINYGTISSSSSLDFRDYTRLALPVHNIILKLRIDVDIWWERLEAGPAHHKNFAYQLTQR
jgi:hypothetical protein